jgi:hypothetical protein
MFMEKINVLKPPCFVADITVHFPHISVGNMATSQTCCTCAYTRDTRTRWSSSSGAGEEQRIDKFEVLSSKRPLWKRDEERSLAIMDCNRQYQYTVEIEKTSFQHVLLFRGDELPRQHVLLPTRQIVKLGCWFRIEKKIEREKVVPSDCPGWRRTEEKRRASRGVNFSERKIVVWLLNVPPFSDLPYSPALILLS